MRSISGKSAGPAGAQGPLSVALACLAALLFCGTARSQIFPAEPYRWGGANDFEHAIAWGDIDGDGDLDVACGNVGQPDCVYLTDDGEISASPDWLSSSADATEAVALGDVDGDGYPDLVCGGLERCALYLNRAGVLETQPTWQVWPGNTIYGLALGDVDGDGDLDLVCGVYGAADALYLNEGGDGGFSTDPVWQSSLQDHTRGVALGDMDRDGDLDLVCGNLGEANTLWLNGGAGSWFGAAPSWSSASSGRTTSLALGDINGDGRLDLVCGKLREATALHLNSAQGLSAAPSWSSPAPHPQTRGVDLGDVDADGDLDLVCGNLGDASTLFRNDAGTFTAGPVWSAGYAYATYGVALADVDGDGTLDVALANHTQENNLYFNTRRLLLEAQPSWLTGEALYSTDVALGDVTGDGLLDVVFGQSFGSETLHLNEGGRLAPEPAWTSWPSGPTEIAMGDVDRDGLCDLVSVNAAEPATLHLGRQYTGLTLDPVWSLVPDDSLGACWSAAIADVDRDGDLDLMIGREAGVALYRNRGGMLDSDRDWQSRTPGRCLWIAAGDVNRDGWPDLLVESFSVLNRNWSHLYLGSHRGFPAAPDWGMETSGLTVVAARDIDGDGRADLIRKTAVHLAEESGFAPQPSWIGGAATHASDVAAGDVDADGDLDLAFSRNYSNTCMLYLNEGGPGLLAAEPAWQSGLAYSGWGLALGDVDADGDLDMVAAHGLESGDGLPNTMYSGLRNPPFRRDLRAPAHQLPNNSAFLRFVRVRKGEPNLLRVSATVFDVESDPVWLVGEYQYEGQRTMFPAHLLAGSGRGDAGRAGPFTSSPEGETHEFDWDVSALPFDTRNVVLHLRVVSHPARAGLVQHIAGYQQQVGYVEPRRSELAVSRGKITFPTMTVGDSAVASIQLRNAGNEPLTISRILSPSPALRVIAATPIALAPRDSARLELLLAPVTETAVSGDLAVESDDPLHPTTTVTIETDILPLRIASRLLTGAPRVPLGEALTVIVTPGHRVAVDGGSLCYRPASPAGALFDSLALVRSASDFIATIPGAHVTEAGLEYYVRVRNGAAAVTDPPAAPHDSVFFQAVSAPEWLVSSPKPNSGARFLEGRPVRVEVTLPTGASVSEGWLHFREGGARDYHTLPLESTRGEEWVATIPDSLAGARGLQYWAEVRTLAATLTDPPARPAAAPHSIRITVQDLAEAEPAGAGRYRMVSVPLHFGEDFTGTLETLLSDQSEFGSYDPLRWRAFRWRAASGDYAELGTPEVAEEFRPLPGRAFWLIARKESRVSTAPVSGASTFLDGPCEILLPPGWSQIGDPFAFAVSWDSVRVGGLSVAEAEAQGVLEPLWRWEADAREYRDDARVLEPFGGYWVKNLTATSVTLRIPPRASAGDSAGARALRVAAPAEASAEGWAIRIVASCGDLRDAYNLAGVQPGAAVQWDRFDRADPPPAPERSLTVYFPRGDWDPHPGNYAVDLRPAAGDRPHSAGGAAHGGAEAMGWAWSFDVAKDLSTDGPEPVALSFTGLDRVPASARIRLIDRQLETTVDLRAAPAYRFHGGGRSMVADEGEARFVLLVGGEEFLDAYTDEVLSPPSVTRLLPPVPSPAWSGALIRYDLAQAARISIALFDVRGARVATLYEGPGRAGRHALAWDGRDDRGVSAAQGTYFCRLTTDTGVRQTRKLIMMR